jgi:hypothetical protein
MKKTFLTPALRKSAMRIPLALGFASALTFLHFNASALEMNFQTANYQALLASTINTYPTVFNGSLGLTPDHATTGGPIALGLYDIEDAPVLPVQNDLAMTATPLRRHHPEEGSSVPDAGSTFLLFAFGLAAIFAFKWPFSVLPGKTVFIKS